MKTLLFLILALVAFVFRTLAWGILIAIGFDIGRRAIKKYDARRAASKVVRDGTF